MNYFDDNCLEELAPLTENDIWLLICNYFKTECPHPKTLHLHLHQTLINLNKLGITTKDDLETVLQKHQPHAIKYLENPMNPFGCFCYCVENEFNCHNLWRIWE